MFNIKKNKTKYDRTSNFFLSKGDRAFTLIELLVVIAIIALLSAVVVTNLNASRLKANDARRDEDMRNVKNAIELYGAKNAYDFSGLVDGFTGYAYQNDEYKKYAKFFNILSKTTDIAYAQQNSGCINFNTMAQRLVDSEFLTSIPKDPNDDSGDICYKAYTAIDSTSGDLVIGAYTLKSEKYLRAPSFNKKTGFIVSRSETLTTIPSACLEFGYPVYDPSYPENPCEGSGNDNKIADAVVGITSGEEIALEEVVDIETAGTCSDSQYTTKTACEMDRSYCNNTSGGPYTTASDCTSAYYMAGAGCSGGNFSDESSCVNAGYYSGGSCSGATNYYDQSSCEGAGYYNPDYCSSMAYLNQSDCVDAGYEWLSGSFILYGHIWTNGPFVLYGYNWYQGTPIPYGWQWMSVPASTWVASQ